MKAQRWTLMGIDFLVTLELTFGVLLAATILVAYIGFTLLGSAWGLGLTLLFAILFSSLAIRFQVQRFGSRHALERSA